MFGRADVTLGGKRIKSVHHDLNILQIHPLPSNYLVRLRTSCYTYELQGPVPLMPWCIFIVSNVILYYGSCSQQRRAVRSPYLNLCSWGVPYLDYVSTHVHQIPVSAVEQPSKLEDVIAPGCTPATTQYELVRRHRLDGPDNAISDEMSTDWKTSLNEVVYRLFFKILLCVQEDNVLSLSSMNKPILDMVSWTCYSFLSFLLFNLTIELFEKKGRLYLDGLNPWSFPKFEGIIRSFDWCAMNRRTVDITGKTI